VFQGSIVALATPLTEELEPDYEALEALVDFHVRSGTSAVVPCGTTGESATLSTHEHDRVVEVVCKAAKGRVPVIAGAGSNATREAVERSRHAASCGADAVLSVVPYYNKPPQEGLFRHFETIAREGGLPVVLYNVPSRTACNLEADTVVRLAEVPGVVAIKEASGDMVQVASILASTDLCVLSGDDPATLPMMSMGAKGVVSVTANVHPEAVAATCAAALGGPLGRGAPAPRAAAAAPSRALLGAEPGPREGGAEAPREVQRQGPPAAGGARRRRDGAAAAGADRAGAPRRLTEWTETAGRERWTT
jgi:4-hydroxy-tetrahydrodipicolinate synthase